MLIRPERPEDTVAIHEINTLAFGQPEEAQIVDELRRSCDDLVSLVAVDGEEVIGHILFSPATIEGTGGLIHGMGLAPMAVLPGRQREGVGSALVERGLAILRERRCPFVVVLGHPEYYPRFGFERASRRGIKAQWPGIPDDVFMVVVMVPGVMRGVSGVVRYRDEFDTAM